jgi:hypothetical protein
MSISLGRGDATLAIATSKAQTTILSAAMIRLVREAIQLVTTPTASVGKIRRS